MGNIIKKLLFFLFLISIGMLIYKFSSQSGETSSTYSGFGWSVILFFSDRLGVTGIVTTYLTEYRLRKLAHIALYFCLGIGTSLVLFECSGIVKAKERVRYIASGVGSIGICTVCACLDEWNQLQAGDRGGMLRDVYIDGIGFVSGTILSLLLVKLTKVLIHNWKQKIVREAMKKERWVE